MGTLTPTIAPGIPSNVIALPGNRSAQIAWNGSGAGSNFTVRRSLTPAGPYFPVSTPAGFKTPTTYEDTGLQNGTTYYYEVVETNSFGASPPSGRVSATPGFKALRLASKYGENLALLPDGSVWRWGPFVGASGGGSPVPTQVDKLPAVIAISSGNSTLALADDGTLWGWGSNTNGELGAGVSSSGSKDPVQVAGIEGVIAVSAGPGYSLAITHDGRVIAWGDNTSGQFGLASATPANSPVPQEVPNLTDIVAVSTGSQHCMALRSDGLVFTWGVNQFGQLGYPPVGMSITGPTQVPNLNGVVSISAGNSYSMALRDDGTVWAWGYNFAGVVGNGTTTTPVVSPVQALNLTSIVAISAGSGTSAAVKSDGTLWTWGGNLEGELGNGTSGITFFPTPAQVQGIRDAVAVETSFTNTDVRSADGTVRAWGRNEGGELGTGDGPLAQVPVELVNFTNVVQVAGGQFFSLVRRSDGTVWGYGTNTAGQVGNGTFSDTIPVLVPVRTALPLDPANGITAVSIAAGNYHGLALLSTGDVYGWAWNQLGPVGSGTSGDLFLSPVKSPALAKITVIACGFQHSLAVRNDAGHPGTVYAWGDNTWGQLGNGSVGGIGPTPTEIPGLTGVAAIAAGERHSLAVKSDGTVWGWGDNNISELGLGPGAPTSVTSPVQIPGISNAVAASAGQIFSAVLCRDGTVWCMGGDPSGQAGLRDVPVQVPGLSGAVGLASGTEFTIAVLNDGGVVGWGSNSDGQLGTTSVGFESPTPVPVQQLSGAVSIGAGWAHSLSILNNGTVWSWGTNGYGELGVPPVHFSTVPVTITR